VRRALPLLTALIALAACTAHVPPGRGEPLVVEGATFVPGALPGEPPLGSDAGTPASPPLVTSVELSGTVVSAGQLGKAISGHVSPDTYSVALALDGLGTGYWIVPAGSPDPTAGGDLAWTATLDLGWSVPPGNVELRVVALDGEGHGGTAQAIPLCVAGAITSDLTACDPTRATPSHAVSLTWDTDVDLDLVVVTPDGKVVSAKRPTTALPGDGGVIGRPTLADPSTGTLDRDSNAGCEIDGVRREDLVWPGAPRPGTYLVYASLYAACGQRAVHFHAATLARGEPTDAGAAPLAETSSRDGVLLAGEATGGATLGTYVLALEIPE